jgi:hypothetical protein
MRFIRNKEGNYKLVPLKNSTFNMVIREATTEGCTVTIPQLSTSDAQRGLGIVGAPDGTVPLEANVKSSLDEQFNG